MDKAVILAAALVVAGGAGFADPQEYSFSNFSEITVGDGVELVVETGPEFRVLADGDRAGLAQLDIQQRGNRLEIDRRMRLSLLRPRGEVQVTVTLPQLTTLEAHAGSEVEAQGALVDLRDVEVSSGAHVVLRGINSAALSVEAHAGAVLALQGGCDDLSLDVSAGAAVDAARLTCATGTADAIAGGAALIHVTDQIVAHAAAGGQVDVAGGPAIRDVSQTAGGSVVLH